MQLKLSASLVIVAAMFQGQVSTRPEVEIWEKVIRAKGGRQKLHSVEILAWSSDAPGLPGLTRSVGKVSHEFVEAYPDRFWSWEDYRPGSMGFRVEVWNARRQLWWQARDGGPATGMWWTKKSESARLQLRTEHQLVFLLETRFVSPAITSSVDKGNVLELRGTAAGFTAVRYRIDKKTWLPTLITLTPEVPAASGSGVEAGHSVEYVFNSYTSVGGIQMPTEIKELGQLRFTLNPDVDPKLFETPPFNVSSRDAWRAFLR